MEAQLRERVHRRANDRCEYCHLPARYAYRPFHIDHIVPEKHGGKTTLDNLAFACNSCNLSKGPNLSGVDPDSGLVTLLYHPRRDRWEDHFSYEGATLRGETPVGRATITVLRINESYLVDLRAALLEEPADDEP